MRIVVGIVITVVAFLGIGTGLVCIGGGRR